MGTTPKMGIPYPESTDPVANGAQNMEDLATTVDNKTGLVKVATISGSGASPFDVTNVFSSNFDSYVLVARLYGSVSTFARWVLLNGSTPATGPNYYRYGYTSVWSGAFNAYNGGAENNWVPFTSYGNAFQYAAMTTAEVGNPFLSTIRTTMSCLANDPFAGQIYHTSGVHETTASYNGFRIVPNAGTLTGEVVVYGRAK